MRTSSIDISPLEGKNVFAVGFSPNGKYLSIAQQKLAILVDLKKAEIVSTVKVAGNRSVATRPTSAGDGLIAGEKSISFFPTPKGKKIAFEKKNKGPVVAIDFDSTEERALTTAGTYSTRDRARIHDLKTGAFQSIFPNKSKTVFLDGVFVSDTEIGLLSCDAIYSRWDIKSGKLLHEQSLEGKSDLSCGEPSSLSADGSLALISLAHECVLWDTKTGAPLFRRLASECVMDATGSRIVGFFNQGTQYERNNVFSTYDVKNDRTLEITEKISSKKMRLSPDGKLLVSVGYEGAQLELLHFEE